MSRVTVRTANTAQARRISCKKLIGVPNMDKSTIRVGDDARDYADEQLTDELLEEHGNKSSGSNDQQSNSERTSGTN